MPYTMEDSSADPITSTVALARLELFNSFVYQATKGRSPSSVMSPTFQLTGRSCPKLLSPTPTKSFSGARNGIPKHLLRSSRTQ